MTLVIFAAAWKQIAYNFLFYLAAMQSIPRSVIEAAAIDGAGPVRRFWDLIFPLHLTHHLLPAGRINAVYAFFDTFGIIHAVTKAARLNATTILVYKVFNDGFVGLDLGGSAAQSVILMILVIRHDRDSVPLCRTEGGILMVENRPLLNAHHASGADLIGVAIVALPDLDHLRRRHP